MLVYKFCLLCGEPLVEGQPPSEERPRLVCASCNYIHYINPKVVSGTLPVEGNRVWLLRRGIEPRLGFWTHPAGYQEWDESTEEAAVRETYEELGCVVAIERLLGVYSRSFTPVVNVVYLARLSVEGQAPCTTKEALQVKLFDEKDLPWDELAFVSTSLALRDWIKLAGM